MIMTRSFARFLGSLALALTLTATSFLVVGCSQTETIVVETTEQEVLTFTRNRTLIYDANGNIVGEIVVVTINGTKMYRVKYQDGTETKYTIPIKTMEEAIDVIFGVLDTLGVELTDESESDVIDWITGGWVSPETFILFFPEAEVSD